MSSTANHLVSPIARTGAHAQSIAFSERHCAALPSCNPHRLPAPFRAEELLILEDLQDVYSENDIDVSDERVREALRGMGAQLVRFVLIHSVYAEIWSLRNHDAWRNAALCEFRKYFDRGIWGSEGCDSNDGQVTPEPEDSYVAPAFDPYDADTVYDEETKHEGWYMAEEYEDHGYRFD